MEPKKVVEMPRRRLFEVVTAEAVTAFATLVSVLILCIQTCQINKSIQDDTYQKAQDRTYDLDRHFIDHPELRQYFYDNHSLGQTADEKMRAQVETTAEWISDFDDSLLSLFEDHPDLDSPYWRSYIQESIENSPAVRTFVRGHPRWYSPDLNKLADGAAAAKK
jgi:hypothetical protein